MQTWNIAEIELVESHRRLRRRFLRVAAFWLLAFGAVLLMTAIGFDVAEAAPASRLGTVPAPAVSAFLAGVGGAAGGLAVLLWRRVRPGKGRPR